VLTVALWPRLDRARRHHVRHRKKHCPVDGPRHRDRLDLIGDSLTGLGPRQVTVLGLPARLRLVVLAPAAAGVGSLTPESHARVLDGILPGLGEIAEFDFPRVECWGDRHARDGFRSALQAGVKAPDPEGAPSRWLLLAGEASAPQGPVHLGLAVLSDAPSATRFIDVPPGQWATVLGLREVPRGEQGW
jgi:hypothetical protein